MASSVGGSGNAGSPNTAITGACSGSGSAGAVTPASSSGYNEAMTARRRTLSVVVACTLQEAGCVTVEKAVVGTLVEMLQSTIVELGRTAKGYCELAYRTEPLVADIVLALCDMGINYDGIHAYARRPNRNIVPSPQVQQDTKHHSVLQVGDKKPHLPYIPDNLPSFPDTHTYCFTPTVKQPVTEYEAIREKAATQKRDIERALTKFATKTNPTESLFIAEDKEFALVCVAPTASQNIDALMPRDQVFEAELDYEVSKARKKRQDRLTNFQHQQQQLKQELGEQEQDVKLSEPVETDSTDNPYLRPVKMPRKSGRGGGGNSKQQQGATQPEPTTPPREESTLGPNISRIVLGSAKGGDQVKMAADSVGGASMDHDHHHHHHHHHLDVTGELNDGDLLSDSRRAELDEAAYMSLAGGSASEGDDRQVEYDVGDQVEEHHLQHHHLQQHHHHNQQLHHHSQHDDLGYGNTGAVVEDGIVATDNTDYDNSCGGSGSMTAAAVDNRILLGSGLNRGELEETEISMSALQDEMPPSPGADGMPHMHHHEEDMYGGGTGGAASASLHPGVLYRDGMSPDPNELSFGTNEEENEDDVIDQDANERMHNYQ